MILDINILSLILIISIIKLNVNFIIYILIKIFLLISINKVIRKLKIQSYLCVIYHKFINLFLGSTLRMPFLV